MKKNKTYTILLAAGVILVWVFALFRFYKSFMGEGSPVGIQKKSELKVSIPAESDEDFVLKANYPDPFSGKIFSRQTNTSGNTRRNTNFKPPEPKKEEIKVDFSFIRYLGLIKNQVNNRQVSLVSVHGIEHRMEEGTETNEVILLKNLKDSIKVSYKGVTAYLRKE